MKSIATLLLLTYLAAPVVAQQSAIQFSTLTYSEALEQAREVQRPVFIYIGHEGCAACLKMEKLVFSDLAVARMVNDNYVSVSVDPNSSFGREISDWFSVDNHPAFVVIGLDESVRHKFVGTYTSEGFMQQLRLGLNDERCLEEFKKRYAEGDRDPQFLLTYLSRMRDAGELTTDMVREYLGHLEYRDFNKPENMQFIYEYSMYNLRPTLNLNDSAFKFLVRNRQLFAKYYNPEQITTRIVLTAYAAAMEAAERQDFSAHQRALALLRTFDKGEGYELLDKDGTLQGRIAPKQLALTAEITYYYKGFLVDQAELRK